METSSYRPTFALGDERFCLGGTDARAVLARAHHDRLRPLCTCVESGVEMCVAALGDAYVLKRMPGTGTRHAPFCSRSTHMALAPEPVAQARHPSIQQDPVTGVTKLRLAFSLRRTHQPETSEPADWLRAPSHRSDDRLSLEGLLFYLWERAELTRWQPSFAGKRTWHIVQRRLRAAARHLWVDDAPLLTHLYIPEAFDRRRIEAQQRVLAHRFEALRRHRSSTAILVAELKTVVLQGDRPAVAFKHIPFSTFQLPDRPHLVRAAERALVASSAHPGGRAIAIATFYVGESGLAEIDRLRLRQFDDRWIPLPHECPQSSQSV